MSAPGAGRAPLAALVTRWAMQKAREGVRVDASVIAFLQVLAERYNQGERLARPGMATLLIDTGWSDRTIARTRQAAVGLGAVTVEQGGGRGLASEFRFTAAVLRAPSLKDLAEADRRVRGEKKHPQPCGGFPVTKPPQGGPETPAAVGENPRAPGAPTVSSTVSSTGTPPLPPADAGGARAIPIGRELSRQLLLAANRMIELGAEATPRDRRRLRQWLCSGRPLDQVLLEAEILARRQVDQLGRERDESPPAADLVEAFSRADDLAQDLVAWFGREGRPGELLGMACGRWPAGTSLSRPLRARVLLMADKLLTRQSKPAAHGELAATGSRGGG